MIFNSTLKQIYIHFQTQGRDFVNFVFSFKKHILTIITITPSPLQLLPPSVSLFHLSPSSSVPFVVLLLSSWPWQCCVVAASSFFPFEVSYPSSFVVVVCLWLLLLVFLMDGKFIGVHCVCLLLQCIFSWCSAKMNRQSVWVFSKNIFLLLK